jgi:hypothetical protein
LTLGIFHKTVIGGILKIFCNPWVIFKMSLLIKGIPKNQLLRGFLKKHFLATLFENLIILKAVFKTPIFIEGIFKIRY